MKLSIFPLFLFLVLSFNLDAQSVVTGVVADSLNNPVPFASVYLSKTTIGTLTDNNGTYSLTIPQDGAYEMIASCVGYRSESRIIYATGNKQMINVKLYVNMVMLNEITVRSGERYKQKDLYRFIKLFIGETVNSQSCKILNPEDLNLRNDYQNGILKGFSHKPIRIENKALGYTILYDLTDFNFDYNSGVLKFTGSPFFQPLTGTLKQNKRWERNRLIAYYGSRMHFLRALFSDSVSNENFKIFECRIDSATGEWSVIKQAEEDSLRMSYGDTLMTVFDNKPLMIRYTDNHPELFTGLLGFQQQVFVSSVTFSDTLRLYPNGYHFNPYSVIWAGEMANERIADMLPFDFRPLENGEAISGADIISSPIEKLLLSGQNSESRDQVFVHTDRNSYRPYDTIHFQAYIRNRFTGVYESSCTSLYALLFNRENGIADSSRFKIAGSTSSGWMTIPADAKPGRYHFAAFTSRMQNYDPSDAFQIDLTIREIKGNQEKIEITYNKKNYEPGDTLEAIIKISDNKGVLAGKQKLQSSLMIGNYTIDSKESSTDKDGESVLKFTIPDTINNQPRLHVITGKKTNNLSTSREFNIPFENQNIELKFLPEGGTMVAGLEQRIGFNATNNKGEPVYIEGLLKTGNGMVADTIKSGIYGPGFFICTPQPGMYVELIKGAGSEKVWPLPHPLESGICLSVKPVDERSFAIEILSDIYKSDTITVTGIMNMNQIFSQELILDKKQRIIVETDQLPQGVALITLFDNVLRPIAERLFYVNADKHLKFNINTGNRIHKTGEKTELSISVTDGQGNPVEGIFSISVADSLSGHDAEIFTPDIEYTFNYHPYFSGNLPAKVLVEGLSNISQEQRDLLLMVYGWSRFTWDFKQTGTVRQELQDYDLLKMKILYALKNRRIDRRLDLISLEGPSIKHFITNKNGEISITLDSLPDITRSVTMMPDTKNKKRVNGAMLSIPYNEKFFKSNKLLIPQPSIPLDAYDSFEDNYNFSLGDSVIEIPEVTITGYPGSKKEYHDKYEEMYQYANVRSLDYEILWSSSTLKDALYRLIKPYMVTENFVILRPPRSFFGGGIPALIVLDGMPIYSSDGWRTVSSISASEVTSLTILVGGKGYTMYGNYAQGGVIFVNTRSDNPALRKIRTQWLLQNKKDNMLLPINIYRQNIEFYSPSKEEIDFDPVIQSRSTIFWAPEVYFNGKDPVKIEYTNLNRHGPVRITINGVSFNNLAGTGRTGYRVYEEIRNEGISK